MRTFQHCTFSTRGSFGFAYTFGLTDAKQPGFGTYDPGDSATAAVQNRSRWPSSSGLGPRADRLNAAALGAVSRSAYFIGTRAPAALGAVAQCPCRPTSSGLGPRADRPNAAALGAVSRSAYFIETRPASSGRGPRGISPVGYVPVQATVPVQGRRRAARSGPIRNCSHAHRPVGLYARLVLNESLSKSRYYNAGIQFEYDSCPKHHLPVAPHPRHPRLRNKTRYCRRVPVNCPDGRFEDVRSRPLCCRLLTFRELTSVPEISSRTDALLTQIGPLALWSVPLSGAPTVHDPINRTTRLFPSRLRAVLAAPYPT